MLIVRAKILNTISPAFGSQFQKLKLGITTTSIKLTSANGKIYNLKLNVPFSSLPRTVLDDFLWSLVKENSSTSVFENTTVSSIQINEDHVLVNTLSGETFKAKTIVGCDGTHSVVQSWLTKTRESVVGVYPSMRAYYKNVKGVKSNQLEIHYHKKIPKGYFWIFPSTDGLVNVGIGASKDELVKHKINLRKVFFDMIQNQDGYADRFADAEQIGDLKGWSIPIGYFDGKLPISGNRVCYAEMRPPW
jgi:flavin-dependent dehydrogenase